MPRYTRLIITPVVLLLALTFLCYAAWWGYGKIKQGPGPRAEEICVMTDVGPELTPEEVTIRVLNGGSVGGLAKRTSTYLLSYGFNSIKVNNIEGPVNETRVIGNSPNDPEVKLVMGFFEDAIAIGDGRTDHVVDVVVGNAYKAPQKPTVTAVAVAGPVCLPKMKKTTGTSESPQASELPSAQPVVSDTPQ